jgi:hypothetical protein
VSSLNQLLQNASVKMLLSAYMPGCFAISQLFRDSAVSVRRAHLHHLFQDSRVQMLCYTEL